MTVENTTAPRTMPESDVNATVAGMAGPAIIRGVHPGALLVSLEEAGRRLDCSKRTIERERDRGNLKCVRLGGRWKVSVAELQRYVRNLESR